MRHARSGVVEVQLLRRPLGQKVAAGPECWHEALRNSTCRSNSTARRSLADNDKWPRSDAPIFFIVGASASGGAILGPGRGPHGDLERGSLSDFVPSPRKTRLETSHIYRFSRESVIYPLYRIIEVSIAHRSRVLYRAHRSRSPAARPTRTTRAPLARGARGAPR